MFLSPYTPVCISIIYQCFIIPSPVCPSYLYKYTHSPSCFLFSYLLPTIYFNIIYSFLFFLSSFQVLLIHFPSSLIHCASCSWPLICSFFVYSFPMLTTPVIFFINSLLHKTFLHFNLPFIVVFSKMSYFTCVSALLNHFSLNNIMLFRSLSFKTSWNPLSFPCYRTILHQWHS